MASKRKLKKGFSALALSLYDQTLLLSYISKDEDFGKLIAMLDDMMVWTDDTIRRIGNPDAPKNPKLVKAYYKKLREDIANKTLQLEDELNKILEQL